MNKNHSNNFYVIGMMSGTSLDGLDICYVHFNFSTTWHYEIIYADTLPYSTYWVQKLAFAHLQTKSYVETLNLEYSNYLNHKIHEFISKYAIQSLDLIASHGHTIWHQPDKGFTKQIGDHRNLVKNLKVPVVVDFRTQDVEFGGQGAPLVPVGDSLLFSDFDACLNFGGFANVSMRINQQLIAFDVCPFNKVLNHYANQLGKDFDEGGHIAATNNVNKSLLKALNGLEYYQKKPPKSLGVEYLNSIVFPLIDKYNITNEVKIATFSKHISIQIAEVIKNHSSVFITGGGAYNKYIINQLYQAVNTKLILPERKVIDFKEAFIFGFLGVLKYLGEINVISTVTGACKSHSSGKIIQPS